MPSVACTICAECLELDHQVVTACPCGHVYHEECVKQWLGNSATCPLCREKAPARSLLKLFFEAADDQDRSQDPAKLKNALDEVSLQVTQLKKDKGDLVCERDRLLDTVDTLNTKVKTINKRVKQEQTINDSFRRQLSFITQENEQAKECKRETKKLREKVQHLERFERIMTENTEAVEDMMKEIGDHSQASMELATYCIAIKHEFEAAKLNRRSLRDEIDKLRKENSSKSRELMNIQKDNDHMLQTHQSLRDEIKTLLEERERMKARQKALEKAVSSGASSVLLQTPKLNRSGTGPINLDFENSPIQMPGCPDTPELTMPGPSTQVKKTCQEFDINYVKTTSKSKKPTVRSEERIALQSLANSSLFAHTRNKADSGKVVKGFDGLGGHRRFIRTEQMKRALPQSSRPAMPKKKIKIRGMPMLPTMDNFLS